MIAKTQIKTVNSSVSSIKSQYKDNSTPNEITIDLRHNQEIRNKRNYTLADITYSSSSYSDVGAADVVPLILLEKQPKYPIYADSIGDVVAAFYDWVRNAPTNKLIGKAGVGFGEYYLQAAGKDKINQIVERLSQSPNAASYWSNPQTYGYHMFGLFNIEGNAPIATYELPFYSDYFLSTDGRKGWKTGGAELWYGRNLAQLAARFASIGYPTTPDWEFEPNFENLDFTFHLINDSPEATLKNTIWLYSLVAGTMYVQIENEQVDLTKADQQTVNMLTMAVTKYLTSISSFFKSPNVYEIVVPGRLRWLWCSMSVNVKCVGKLYKDGLTRTNGATESMADNGAAFPEAYKVEVSFQSLLPQSFNQFNYFLTTKSSAQTPITDASSAGQKMAQEIIESLKKSPIYKAAEATAEMAGEALKNLTDFSKDAKTSTEWMQGQMQKFNRPEDEIH